MSVEQAFRLQTAHPNTDQFASSPVKIEAPRELPKVSLVNTSLKRLKYHLDQFDNVVKKWITLDALTEWEWRFEHTKAVFLKEIIPFLKTLKDIFNVFDKDLLNEVTEVQTVFNQMEAVVQQYFVEKQYVVNIVVNSYVNMNNSVNMHSSVAMNDSVNYVENCNKCLELEAKLIKQHNMVEKDEYNRLLKRFIKLEQHFISHELAMQLNKEIFQKNNTSVNQNEPTFDHSFDLNNLKAELQAKDTTIEKLKANIKYSASYSACKYVKLIQELLGYVRDTCPDIHNPSEILVAVTPINKKKIVRFAEPVISSSTSQKQLGSSQTNTKETTNNSVSTSTGVRRSTKSNSSMFDARHELCFLEFVSDLNASSKSKSVKKAKKKEEWKPTGKVITATNKVLLREPIPLEVVAQVSVVTKFYTRRPMVPKTNGSNSKPKIAKSMISNKTELGTSRGSNTSVTPSSYSFSISDCKDYRYGDYQIGNITISRVYYVEGLGHNLFSVGQFYDSDLEVAFRKHMCFICNLEGVDLLSESQETNLYTLSIGDMMASSLICLLSKASKTKSWLWH
ncbi:hypothetical protein Tco_0212694 [Tanacetum coccineum]